MRSLKIFEKFFLAIYFSVALFCYSSATVCDPLILCPPCGVLAPSLPCCTSTPFTTSVSFLFWQGKLWGLEFGGKSFAPNIPGESVQTFNQKLLVPDFAWRPGVKAKLGYQLPYDAWDLLAGWTYYHEECTSLKKHITSVTAPSGIGVVPMWHYPFLQISGGNTGNPLRYDSAAANWRMNFNSFDLELGRYFIPGKSIPMKLKMGVKGALIRQFYHAQYGQGTTIEAIDPDTSMPDLFQFNSSHFQVRTNQWGLGPKIGLESRWHVWRGFSLIGDGSFSILCSFYDLKTRYKDVIQPNPGPTSMKMKEHFRELTPVCEAMLGIEWRTCLLDEYFLGMTLGYECQYWWSINHARRHYVQTIPGETFDARGDLQMQGLNASIKVDY
jgi:hypothetical protein